MVEGLHPLVEKLFKERFGQFTPPQLAAMPKILAGENVLLIAPTGSGKTEAALIPVLSGIVAMGREKKGIKALYITPLRALNRDMLERISWWSARLDIRVAVRHGDTPQADRKRMEREPPDLLITTPETLQAILTGKVLMAAMASLKWVIVDEVHELASSKRGAQLAVGLERLRAAVGDFQVIGLSATVGTPDEVGKYIFSRSVDVITWVYDRVRDYRVTYYDGLEAASKRVNRIREVVGDHKAIVFVNSRTIAEELGYALSDVAGLAVHHGSLSRIEREDVERAFRGGSLRAIVATSTLELGIDVGEVDYVVQYMSPRRVVDLLQRMGRGGHRLGTISRGEIIAVSVEDALESLSCLSLMSRGYLEPPTLPRGPLDVAAHQLLGVGLDRGGVCEKDYAYGLLIRTGPFRELEREQFEELLKFMEKMRLVRLNGESYAVTGRGRINYLKNISMINDEKLYPVIDVSTGKRIASVGMEFVVTRMYVGMDIILKGKAWKILRGPVKDDDRITVEPSSGQAAVPGWDGEMAPVSREVAAEALKLRKELDASSGAPELLRQSLSKENEAMRSMRMELPGSSVLVLEAWQNYLIVHYPLGDMGARALGFYLESALGKYVRYWWSNAYRVVLELAIEGEDLVEEAVKALRAGEEEGERAVMGYFKVRFPFAYQMKFIAERFGALEKRTPRENQVQMFPAVYAGTPIYDEALREGLETRVSVSDFKRLMKAIRSGAVTVSVKRGEELSPLASASVRAISLSELPSAGTPISVFRASLDTTQMALVCLGCGRKVLECKVGEYQPTTCPSCGSPFLAPVFGPTRLEMATAISSKRARGEKLSEEESKLFAELKRAADILVIYGIRGARALSVYGIGPETASRILSRLPDEETFLKSLMDARQKYLETKPYW
ncbi:DEAD/DEAH box helicase [Tardisphaera miroshnichenkoae]